MRYLIPALMVCLSLPLASAQQYLPQTGNLFDANPQIGGNGVNTYRRPVSPLIGGNSLTTGNVRYGASFQGRSTISDPTAFRARLGSTSLSAFRRDSFGGIDQSRFSSGGLGAGFNQTYYSRSSTAPTASFLRGYSGGLSRRPIGSETRRVTPFVGTNPGRLDSRIDSSYRPPTTTGLPRDLSDPMGTPSAASAIFRFHRPQERGMQLTHPSAPMGHDITERALQTPAWVRQPGSSQASVSELLNDGHREDRMGVLLGEKPANSLLINPRLHARLDESTWNTRLIQGAQPRPDETPHYSIATSTKLPEASDVSVAVDPSALPGYDLYSDMKMALELKRNPDADWYRQMRQSAMASSDIEGKQLEVASQDANEFVQHMLDLPLKTFVGEGRTMVNNELLKAESLMEIEHFYEAAQRYQAAAAIEPGNPLPLLGQAHALLAAGEYNSAAHTLVRAIERFPDIARFRFDLQSLLGSSEVVDIRRADLMSRLETKDDPRLRLLLGYLEYYGGLPEKGLENLKLAAEDAGVGSVIAKYVETLEQAPERPAVVPQSPNAPERQSAPKAAQPKPSRVVSPQLVVPPKLED